MSGLLPLFMECEERGLNVVGLSGWTDWQRGYWFRREGEWSGSGRESNPPTFFMNHHTASAGYTPYVVSNGKSKANIWLGLKRPGSSRLYEQPPGVPTAYFAVRWAANYGNGACNRDVYERYVWRDRVAPNRPSGGDNGYANKLGIGMEIVHRGTGQIMDPGVFELAAQINAAAMKTWDWSIARILDHRSSTTRKVDLDQAQKERGYTINALRTRVEEIAGSPTTPPIEPPEDDVKIWPPFNQGDGMGELAYLRAAVAWLQGELNLLPAVSPKVTTDGRYGAATAVAVDQAFAKDTQEGAVVNGNNWRRLIQGNHIQTGGGSGPPDPHSHPATTTIGVSS
jgi:hypothetical protein